MSPLVFLAGAAVLSVVLSVLYWWSQREPSTLESSIEAFNRGLDVVAKRVAEPVDEAQYGPDDPETGTIQTRPLDAD